MTKIKERRQNAPPEWDEYGAAQRRLAPAVRGWSGTRATMVQGRDADRPDPPSCMRCQLPMALVHIEPDEPGHDQRTFACTACHSEMRVRVRYR